MKTFSVGFAEAGDGNELADARSSRRARRRPPRARALVRRADDRPRRSRLASRRAARRPLLARLPRAVRARGAARHRRARPGRAPTSSSAAIASIARPRSPARGIGLPRPLRQRRCSLPRARPGRASRGPRARSRAADPAARLLAMSGALDATLRRSSSAVRWPSSTAAPRCARSRTALGDFADDPLPATLFLDGQLGLVDDMLHYFDRASMAHSLEVRVPFLDHHLVEFCATIPAGPQGPPADDEARPQARPRAASSPTGSSTSRRSASSTPRSTAGSAPRRAGAIADYLLGPSPAVRGVPRPGRGRAPRRSACDGTAGPRTARCCSRSSMLEVWLSDLPAARALHRASPRAAHRGVRPAHHTPSITPARDEAENLPRLAASLAAQTMRPATWLDRRQRLAPTRRSRSPARSRRARLGARPVRSRRGRPPSAAQPIVRALQAGLARSAAIRPRSSSSSTPTSRSNRTTSSACSRFDADPLLGMASGSAFELEDGDWRQRHVTGRTVWGASRAYRLGLPAGGPAARGAGCVGRHRRVQGERPRLANAGLRGSAVPSSPTRGRARRRLGVRAGIRGWLRYYLGYRPWYLVLRSLWNARREPTALAMIAGYAGAASGGSLGVPTERSRLSAEPAERPGAAIAGARGRRTPRPN